MTHEKSDVSTRLIAYFLIGLAATGILVQIGLGYYWKFLGAQESSERDTVSRWKGPRDRAPAPRLQTAPEQDLNVYREAQQRRLNAYGIADTATGAVHIPIDRAMDLLIQRGVK